MLGGKAVSDTTSGLVGVATEPYSEHARHVLWLRCIGCTPQFKILTNEYAVLPAAVEYVVPTGGNQFRDVHGFIGIIGVRAPPSRPASSLTAHASVRCQMGWC